MYGTFYFFNFPVSVCSYRKWKINFDKIFQEDFEGHVVEHFSYEEADTLR